jgi:hypothetical protein
MSRQAGQVAKVSAVADSPTSSVHCRSADCKFYPAFRRSAFRSSAPWRPRFGRDLVTSQKLGTQYGTTLQREEGSHFQMMQVMAKYDSKVLAAFTPSRTHACGTRPSGKNGREVMKRTSERHGAQASLDVYHRGRGICSTRCGEKSRAGVKREGRVPPARPSRVSEGSTRDCTLRTEGTSARL